MIKYFEMEVIVIVVSIIGKKINIQEGARVVGYATITKIFNPFLCLEGRA